MCTSRFGGSDSTTSPSTIVAPFGIWYANGEPLSALTADLEPTFGEKRARLIAMTETTRAAARGSYVGYKESGVVTRIVWKTVGPDERTCPICSALHGKTVALEGGRFYDELPIEIQARLKRVFEIPPSHPSCRCRIAARIERA